MLPRKLRCALIPIQKRPLWGVVVLDSTQQKCASRRGERLTFFETWRFASTKRIFLRRCIQFCFLFPSIVLIDSSVSCFGVRAWWFVFCSAAFWGWCLWSFFLSLPSKQKHQGKKQKARQKIKKATGKSKTHKETQGQRFKKAKKAKGKKQNADRKAKTN